MIAKTAPVSDLFWQTTKPVWAKQLRNKGNEIATGTYADDPQFLKYWGGVLDDLNDMLPPDLDEDGFVGASGVHETFDRFRIISGYAQTPLSIPLANNENMRKEAGLPTTWRTGRDRLIFRELCHNFFKSMRMPSLKTNRISSSGFPRHDSDYKAKIDDIERVLQPATCSQIFANLRRGDHVANLRDHGVSFATRAGVRRQEDPPEKVRRAQDREFALSGGLRGATFDISKEVILADGSRLDGWACARMRIMRGSAITATALIAPGTNAVRKGIGEDFAFTYKHRTPAEIAEKVNKYGNVYSTDYTNFDTFFPAFMIAEMCDVAREYFSEDYVVMIEKAFKAPFFMPPINVIQANMRGDVLDEFIKSNIGFWMGNPLDDREYILNQGIISGNPWVDILGKLGGSFDCLIKWDRIANDVLERMRDYLRGDDEDFGFTNMGDDNRALFRHAHHHKLFGEITVSKKNGKDFDHSYFAADFEKGQVFTGGALTRFNKRGEVDMLRVIPRIGSMLRFFTNERAITDPARAFWPIGFFERIPLYGENPAFGQVWETLTSRWRHTMKTDLVDMADKAYKTLPYHNLNVSSIADLETLVDPEKLAWRYTENGDVSQNIRDLFEKPVDQHLVEQYCKGIFLHNVT